ncbi:MAG TPA: metalloregulator ArsR/SmtB family transcription factor [Turneriella sp.]|nr:metalloregulator ArsR/SmtB family transcription factor [Turneriella sp.]HNA78622.1 metalloregulator ArsR/SmtB family transcription factor [Turneriella sp.]HNE18666.1 metalloregulator ArsR/SmtB family transcription factor [Turneriella sp.]HNL10533.1 metalloregulator ArsR/SmtB family transcription factor [Turneriella sp.]HNL55809.1 metalloregulator ArsR/SmtB family transcription factor [Turneriella sp.]
MTTTTSSNDHLSLTFAALADPTRRAMLVRLGQGPATVSELAQPFQISAPAISKHIKVLEKAGLITREKEAQWRRCRIEAQRLREANEFIERYRKFWEDSFDRLELYLQKLQAKDTLPEKSAKAGAAGSIEGEGI